MHYRPDEIEDVRRHLRRLLTSKDFLNADRAKLFLELVVDTELAGDGHLISIQWLVAQLTAMRKAKRETAASENSFGSKKPVVGEHPLGRKDEFTKENLVSTAEDVRGRLRRYYDHVESDHAVQVSVPKNGFRPTFTFTKGESHEGDAIEPVPFKRRSWLPIGRGRVALVAIPIVVLGVLFASRGRTDWDPPKFDTLVDSANVGQFEPISGTGGPPRSDSSHTYLILEPLVGQSTRHVQAPEIVPPRWTVSAHFGESNTPPGTRFRADIVQAPIELPPGPRETDPPGSRVLLSIIVVRR